MEALDGIYTGLFTLWNSDPTLQTIPVFRDEAPKGREAYSDGNYFPYVVIRRRLDSQMGFESCQRQYWDHYLNLEVHDRDSTLIEPTLSTLATFFNSPSLNAKMVMPAGHFFQCCRQVGSGGNERIPPGNTGDTESRILKLEIKTSVAI